MLCYTISVVRFHLRHEPDFHYTSLTYHTWYLRRWHPRLHSRSHDSLSVRDQQHSLTSQRISKSLVWRWLQHSGEKFIALERSIAGVVLHFALSPDGSESLWTF
jgi:hypothetical protein